MNNGKAVVLVVEDSAIIRMGAVDLVHFAGYEALEARDADEAIRILESRSDIDLVFTDDGWYQAVPLHSRLVATRAADRRFRQGNPGREQPSRGKQVVPKTL